MSEALEYVESRAKAVWGGWLLRLLRFIIRFKPIRVVWIEEYEDGDWDRAHCKGKASRSWQYDGNGLSVVKAIGPIDKTSPIASTTPVISFCLDEHGRRMIYTEWHGCRAAHGTVLVFHADEGWIQDRPAWRMRRCKTA